MSASDFSETRSEKNPSVSPTNKFSDLLATLLGHNPEAVARFLPHFMTALQEAEADARAKALEEAHEILKKLYAQSAKIVQSSSAPLDDVIHASAECRILNVARDSIQDLILADIRKSVPREPECTCGPSITSDDRSPWCPAHGDKAGGQ